MPSHNSNSLLNFARQTLVIYLSGFLHMYEKKIRLDKNLKGREIHIYVVEDIVRTMCWSKSIKIVVVKIFSMFSDNFQASRTLWITRLTFNSMTQNIFCCFWIVNLIKIIVLHNHDIIEYFQKDRWRFKFPKTLRIKQKIKDILLEDSSNSLRNTSIDKS